jgi:Spy/CpxP family protein refolding chaperone
MVMLVSGLAVATAQAQAGGSMQPPPQGGHTGHGQAGTKPGEGMKRMNPMAELNLTEAQTDQIHKLMAESQAKQQDVREKMQKLHEQLRDQVFADNGPADQEAKATAKEIRDLQADMMEQQIDLHEKIAEVLDPAQRKKMREMPMEAMMGMMMGHGPMAGPRKMPPPKK